MKINNITGLLVAGTLVLIGMSLPWAHIGQRGFSLSISGWRGTANIGGVSLPGVFVAASAAVAIVLMLGEARNQWTRHVPKFVPVSLCIYGLMHTGFMGLALANTPEMNLGFGVIVTLFGLAMLLASMWSVNSRPPNDSPLNHQNVTM